jgi:hypothetical protein
MSTTPDNQQKTSNEQIGQTKPGESVPGARDTDIISQIKRKIEQDEMKTTVLEPDSDAQPMPKFSAANPAKQTEPGMYGNRLDRGH